MFSDDPDTVTIDHSGESPPAAAATLEEELIPFLEYYGVSALMGRSFGELIGAGDGRTKLGRLAAACGYVGDPRGFCAELIRQLMPACSQKGAGVRINGVDLPQLLLVAVLEKLLPGDKFTGIQSVAQLEKLTNMLVPEAERDDLQQVIDAYPVRLSMHTIRQMRVSRAVAYQYLPFVEELDQTGHTNTWIGQFHQGLLEQMYQNRVIFLLNMSCPVYCRFCFRKHKESRDQSNPTVADVDRALAHVRCSPGIKEVVITGGDPFLNRANMARAIDGLTDIEHVQTLRLATRSVAYYPHLFLGHGAELLTYLKIKNLQLRQKEKRLELATHFIHPDEISPDSLEIIAELVKNGIAVYVQTPFLRDCNDKGPELARLFSLLRGAGAELHYIYIPCSPIHGNSIYWTPISAGHQAVVYLRAHLSDRVIPRLCTATPIGKMDWHTSGWAVEQDPENARFIWIRTPYTPDYFKTFAPLAENTDTLRVNAEGTIDARYMARIGDPHLLLGPRGARLQNKPAAISDKTALSALQAEAVVDQGRSDAVVKTGLDALRRVHATRVELDAAAGGDETAYIKDHPAITDVVVIPETDAVEDLLKISGLVQRLQQIPHVNAVRLRSVAFNYRPGRYTKAMVARLGDLNRLTVVNPLRLEIETQFLHSREIRPDHRRIAAGLQQRGVTVYANVPLLTGVNDSPAEINRIAYGLRQCGIEFHHLFVAGLPLQKRWNGTRPLDVADVIDIATRVRREGSGREIPRYIIRTGLGEVDFGLTSQLLEENGQMHVRLTPYDRAYFQAMDPEFDWPQGVQVDGDGRPTVAVTGLTSSDGFLVSGGHA
ncbi:MAG: radical SAM protein [Desulfobacterales bacterium]